MLNSIVDRLTHNELALAADLYVEICLKHAVDAGHTEVAVGVAIEKYSHKDNYQIKHTVRIGSYPNHETFTGTNLFDVLRLCEQRQKMTEEATPPERTLALPAPETDDDLPI